ncbi:hypothetical protein [Bradyrhizobium sp. 33ap4]|uniref:hypothetical protein n=1 Tax=Bradyrhizobium sp. 33ap4 TaxID=3061630 RepID=UPI002931C52E|nr:hypothetical protein [Bradyrhizobium sp. 33ap4]
MHTANIRLSLGGDHGNTVYKWGVTAAEIAVLRAIHGEESVQDVEPVGNIKRAHSVERARLMNIYGNAKVPNSEQRIVENLYPGAAARVHEELHELDIPEAFFKAQGHMTTDSRPGWDAGLRQDGPTIAEWMAAGYRAEHYPPNGYASKSTEEEIALAIESQGAAKPAPVAQDDNTDGDDEDVGEDMNDEIGRKNAEGDGADKGSVLD